ncbi:MAG: histidine kinase [Rhizobiaceae bacterium]
MPTLLKFLTILAIIGGVVYGAMFALVTFVEPKPGEMTVRIPTEKVNPPRN